MLTFRNFPGDLTVITNGAGIIWGSGESGESQRERNGQFSPTYLASVLANGCAVSSLLVRRGKSCNRWPILMLSGAVDVPRVGSNRLINKAQTALGGEGCYDERDENRLLAQYTA